MADSRLQQFLGGSPVSVAIKLALLSLLVGALLAGFGFTPLGFLNWLRWIAQEVLGTGIEAVYSLIGYVAAGAVIVVPIWFLIRLLAKK